VDSIVSFSVGRIAVSVLVRFGPAPDARGPVGRKSPARS
jgi:hypothetical protein